MTKRSPAHDVGAWLEKEFIEAAQAFVEAIHSDDPQAIETFRAIVESAAASIVHLAETDEHFDKTMSAIARRLVQRARDAAFDRKMMKAAAHD
jgi:hypothetical protein